MTSLKRKEGAEELKSEQRDREATTTWRQQRREADGTSTAQRSWAHAVQCCSMTVSAGGPHDSTSRELKWWKATWIICQTVGQSLLVSYFSATELQ